MISPALPPHEAERLAALRATRLLDTPVEDRFDRLTRLACRVFGVEIAAVTLVDADRQWFKSRQGMSERRTDREVAFAAHTILGPEPFVVEDARLDPRFAANPLVTGPMRVRFYAGAPLTAAGRRIGSFCLLGRSERQFNEADRRELKDLARLAEREIETYEPELALAGTEDLEGRFDGPSARLPRGSDHLPGF